MKVFPLFRPLYLIRQCVVKACPPTTVISMMWPSTPPDRRYISRCSVIQSRRVSLMAADDSVLMVFSLLKGRGPDLRPLVGRVQRKCGPLGNGRSRIFAN